jgi:hypothetical protein
VRERSGVGLCARFSSRKTKRCTEALRHDEIANYRKCRKPASKTLRLSARDPYLVVEISTSRVTRRANWLGVSKKMVTNRIGWRLACLNTCSLSPGTDAPPSLVASTALHLGGPGFHSRPSGRLPSLPLLVLVASVCVIPEVSRGWPLSHLSSC